MKTLDVTPEIESAPTLPRTRGGRASLLIPLLLLGLASGLRLWHLGSPSAMIADESYYSLDAEAYLGGMPPFLDVPSLAIAGERSWMHPPLGKELIAAGEGPLGQRPWGWRLPSAIVGIAAVMAVYWLALLLWGSPWWAGLAGLLVAIDGMHLVMSRLAMLDIFAGTFAVAGLALLVRDRSRPDAPVPVSTAGRLFARRGAPIFGTPSRCWAGIFLGAAVACKWSGALTLLFAGTLAAAWAWRGDLSGDEPRRHRVATVAASFLVLPLFVYLLAYLPFWFAHGPDLAGFVRLQRMMLSFHEHYDRANANTSSPLGWPLQLHPLTAYPQEGTGPVTARIVTIGNPVLWYGSLLCLPVLAWFVRARGAWRERVILGAYLTAYLPWLFVSRPTFSFYMTAVVPFMALCLVAVLRQLPGRARRPGAIAIAVSAGAMFLFFAPVLLGIPVQQAWLDATRWLPSWG